MQAIGSYFLKGVGITVTEELLSVPEVGDRLGVSVYTVRRWIKSGDLLAYRPGKEYRIRESDLEKFLEAHGPKVAAPSSPVVPNEEERRLRYLRALELFATSMESRWAAKVERDVFSEMEFEDGVAALTDLESAYIKGIGTDLFKALRTHAITLANAEQETLNSVKDSIDAWHRTMWRAYDALRARGTADVARLADYRKRLRADDGATLGPPEQAAGE